MVMANSERMQRALDVFRDGLLPACEQTFAGFYGDDWVAAVNRRSNHLESTPSKTDVAFLFKVDEDHVERGVGQRVLTDDPLARVRSRRRT